MNTNYLYSVIVLLIVAAVVRYVARNAKKWVTPSGTTLEEQLKKRDERMAQAQRAPLLSSFSTSLWDITLTPWPAITAFFIASEL